jgi:protein-S-isoprenylcysteine O-methyltransferase Ste14
MNEGLVFAQFGLLATLILQVTNRWQTVQLDHYSAGLLTLSVLLAAWALIANRPGNFKIVPEPKQGGKLVTHGPYHYIRHPMYSSLLLFAAVCAIVIDGWWAWFNWLALLLVLVFKSAIEEHYLLKHFPLYESYCKRSKRFVPWLI